MDCPRMELVNVRCTPGAIQCVIQGSIGPFGNQGDLLQVTLLNRYITGGCAAQTRHHYGEVWSSHGQDRQGETNALYHRLKGINSLLQSQKELDMSVFVQPLDQPQSCLQGKFWLQLKSPALSPTNYAAIFFCCVVFQISHSFHKREIIFKSSQCVGLPIFSIILHFLLLNIYKYFLILPVFMVINLKVQAVVYSIPQT